MSQPTRVSAPVDLTDVPGGRPVPAGTALDLGAWGRPDALHREREAAMTQGETCRSVRSARPGCR
jgi:hypothetical protein